MSVDRGLGSVAICALDVLTGFSDCDDYWSGFLGGRGPAPAYGAGLPDARRAALRDRPRATLPLDPAGGIALSARAGAVRGTVPAR